MQHCRHSLRRHICVTLLISTCKRRTQENVLKKSPFLQWATFYFHSKRGLLFTQLGCVISYQCSHWSCLHSPPSQPPWTTKEKKPCCRASQCRSPKALFIYAYMKIIILRNLYTHRQISSHFMPSFVLSQFTHGTGDMVSLVNLIYVSNIASFEYFFAFENASLFFPFLYF